jgi:regulatory protein
MQKKYLTKEQALQKLRQYCAYQERSHFEVQQKLWDLGVLRAEHDEIIATLIEEDYLNEERFAMQFAGGKFRMKEWGRKKIWYALKEKKVSDYNIKKALKEIDEETYHNKLAELAEKKYNSLKGEQYLVRRKKTMDYLLQKGYETELVTAAVSSISTKE